MTAPAWQALASLDTVSELTAWLLAEPVTLPETADSFEKKIAAGALARLGPAELTHLQGGIPVRRLQVDIEGTLADTGKAPVRATGVVLFWRGQPVAFTEWEPVELTAELPRLVAYLDWQVNAYGDDGA